MGVVDTNLPKRSSAPPSDKDSIDLHLYSIITYLEKGEDRKRVLNFGVLTCFVSFCKLCFIFCVSR